MIPRPTNVRKEGPGTVLSDGMVVDADDASQEVAALLACEIEAATGWRVHRSAVTETAHGVVRLRVEKGDSPEGYRLKVSRSGIEIVAPSAAGVFYGTRTLRQLLPPDLLRSAPASEVTAVDVAGVEIEDAPRFSWRGIELDVARHFFPKDFVLKLIDLASLHKLNRLHLHLTDDQGWRAQIDRYPLLTKVGAWRRESPLGHYQEGRTDGTPHGGFYTKADLAEIAAYAARRFVTVVPEVDMPGHMQAAVASYPELGNTGQPLEVFTNWGTSEHVLNVEEPTVRFCADVLEEIMGIFPGRYVHIGGDECPTTEWEASPAARRRAEALGLTGPQQLQAWFTARMSEVVSAKGRSLIGWEEVLGTGAPPGSLIMAWSQEHALQAAVQAATSGHDVVITPEQWTYFDWAYSDDPREPVAIRAANSVEHVYSFEPVPAELPEGLEERVLGTQCQLWTEYVASGQHAEYMYFPRACALAEVAWSTGERRWDDFERRLREHTARLGALGVNYRPLDGPTPGQARTWPSGGTT